MLFLLAIAAEVSGHGIGKVGHTLAYSGIRSRTRAGLRLMAWRVRVIWVRGIHLSGPDLQVDAADRAGSVRQGLAPAALTWRVQRQRPAVRSG